MCLHLMGLLAYLISTINDVWFILKTRKNAAPISEINFFDSTLKAGFQFIRFGRVNRVNRPLIGQLLRYSLSSSTWLN